jgi:hypothetical protein
MKSEIIETSLPAPGQNHAATPETEGKPIREPGGLVAHPSDLVFGVFLVGLAALGYFGGRGLTLGSTVRMGPGFVPTALSAIVAGMGVVMLVRGFVGHRGERLEPWAWSKLAYILGSFIAFALTLERLGLVLAVILLVALSSLGAPDRRWWEIAIAAPIAAAFSAIVFKILLGIPLNLWPF